MKRSGALALLFLLGLAACSHRQPQTSAPVPVADDAVYTGVQKSRRAYPVALPVTLPAVSTNSVASAGSPAPTTEASASAPVPATPAAVSAATNATPEAPTANEPAPASVSTTMPSSEPAATSVATSTPPPAASDSSTTPNSPSPVPLTAPSAGPPGLETVPSPSLSDEVVVLETSFGNMVIELDDFAAPKTCANFRHLVNTGFYNNTIFHRAIPQFIIQGGDPNTKSLNRASYGLGDPGYTLPPEIKLHHDRGAVAMARLPDSVNPKRYSNGSQFYICVAPCPSLDGQYTVFAHVIAGLDVADRIAAAPTDRRADPLERIDMKASFEPRDQALRENAATGP